MPCRTGHLKLACVSSYIDLHGQSGTVMDEGTVSEDKGADANMSPYPVSAQGHFQCSQNINGHYFAYPGLLFPSLLW